MSKTCCTCSCGYCYMSEHMCNIYYISATYVLQVCYMYFVINKPWTQCAFHYHSMAFLAKCMAHVYHKNVCHITVCHMCDTHVRSTYVSHVCNKYHVCVTHVSFTHVSPTHVFLQEMAHMGKVDSVYTWPSLLNVWHTFAFFVCNTCITHLRSTHVIHVYHTCITCLTCVSSRCVTHM